MNLVKSALQLVYPSLCRGCQQLIPPTDIFCVHCMAQIRQVPSLIVPISKKNSLKVFAACAYQPPIKTLVVKKFSGDLLASKQLARLMLVYTPLRTMPIDYIIPVPLHWTRYSSRGFNQAYQMAKVIGSELNIPVCRFVRRARKTAFQWKVSGAGRTDNVKNAFDINWWYLLYGTDFIRDKHVVIVDDLCTTGATLVHVAKVIAAAHPASITAVVGCRAI
jgi:ComF family protein